MLTKRANYHFPFQRKKIYERVLRCFAFRAEIGYTRFTKNVDLCVLVPRTSLSPNVPISRKSLFPEDPDFSNNK
uniref:Uncharacterized protein n=1 Tax=Romanomermis culicivorax TaxID=13658 RepID=A0A915K3M0_ROMCU